MNTEILRPTRQNIQLCARTLREGGLVAFPTETVYGLGCSAFDENAAAAVYAAKGRPSDNPLIVHVADAADVEGAAAEVSGHARKIIDALMPGPVTVVLPKGPRIPYRVTGGLRTVAVRIPDSDIARQLIRAAGVPVCAPSANTSSLPSPTSAAHVMDDLNGKIPYILDGGRCRVGIESTIVDCTGDEPAILRRGGVTAETLEELLGRVLAEKSGEGRPLCPGMKYKHYSPLAEVYLFEDDLAALRFAEDKKAAVFTYTELISLYEHPFDMGGGDDTYAQRLFDSFRACDKLGYDVILCKLPAASGIGLSLQNRLVKAAAGKKI